MDVKDFIMEAEWQLNKTNNFKRFQENVTATNMKLLKATTKIFKKIVNGETEH